MRTIVVPLDGSEFSESAVVVATRIATDTDASLRLMRVSPLDEIEADDVYLTRVASTISAVPVSTAIGSSSPARRWRRGSCRRWRTPDRVRCCA